MAALAGVGASVSEASTAFNNSSKWTLSLKGAVKDVTPFGASGSWVINLATLKSWSGKITAFFDTSDTAQTNIIGLLNSTVTLTLNVSSTPHGFTGTAYITEIAPSVDAQGVITCDYSFTGTGSCVYS